MTGCRNEEKSYSYSVTLEKSLIRTKNKKRSGPNFLTKQASHLKWQAEMYDQTSATEITLPEEIHISQTQSQRGNAKSKLFQTHSPTKTQTHRLKSGRELKSTVNQRIWTFFVNAQELLVAKLLLLAAWGRELRGTVEWHLPEGQGLKLANKAKILMSIKTLKIPRGRQHIKSLPLSKSSIASFPSSIGTVHCTMNR